MLTEDQIRENLKNNPTWEPEDVSTEEWTLFETVFNEMDVNDELGLYNDTKSEWEEDLDTEDIDIEESSDDGDDDLDDDLVNRDDWDL